MRCDGTHLNSNKINTPGLSRTRSMIAPTDDARRSYGLCVVWNVLWCTFTKSAVCVVVVAVVALLAAVCTRG